MTARFVALLLCCLPLFAFASLAAADEKDTGGISQLLRDLPKDKETGTKDKDGGISLELRDLPKDKQEKAEKLQEQGADRFAALAYSSSTRRYGYAYNYGSADEAKAAAIKYCGTGDARVVAWVKNGYIAVARGYNGAIGWGWAFDRDTAVEYAHANCLRFSSYSNLAVVVAAKK